jgi:uncharacterized membrane protein
VSEFQGKSPGLERMLFFSDAVIAIAMTLLALELPIPEADDPASLFAALTTEHARQYGAFLIAFALIGASWIGHHNLFSVVAKTDNRLLAINLVGLMGFVLVPWATQALGTSSGGAGVAVFAGVMTILAGSSQLLAWHVDRAGLREPDAPTSFTRHVRISAGIPTLMFALSIPLAFVIGELVLVVWLVVYVVIGVYTRRSATPPAEA